MGRKKANNNVSRNNTPEPKTPYDRKPTKKLSEGGTPSSAPYAIPQTELGFKKNSYTKFLLGRSKTSLKNIKFKTLKQLIVIENETPLTMDIATYSSIEAPPSLKPSKRYCDVTGLEGKYMDPQTKIYYHSPEVFSWIRQQNNAIIQGYLGLRSASTMLI